MRARRGLGRRWRRCVATRAGNVIVSEVADIHVAYSWSSGFHKLTGLPHQENGYGPAGYVLIQNIQTSFHRNTD